MALWIDRIDDRGNIRAHVDAGNSRTLCGLKISQSQAACGNAKCRRCEGLVEAEVRTWGRANAEMRLDFARVVAETAAQQRGVDT